MHGLAPRARLLCVMPEGRQIARVTCHRCHRTVEAHPLELRVVCVTCPSFCALRCRRLLWHHDEPEFDERRCGSETVNSIKNVRPRLSRFSYIRLVHGGVMSV